MKTYRQVVYLHKMEEVPFLFTYKILLYFKHSRLIFSTLHANLAVLRTISFYELLQIQIFTCNV